MIEITIDYLASQGLSKTFPQRFWAKVKKTKSCWLWTGSKNIHGYGQIHRRFKHGRPIGSAVASWILHNGPIPEGLFVLHNCPEGDNPSCVNPNHLWLGTQADNVRDCHKKGRARNSPKRGEDNPRHKLTWEMVRQARKEYRRGAFIRSLARKFAVSQRAMQFCIRMKTWVKH